MPLPNVIGFSTARSQRHNFGAHSEIDGDLRVHAESKIAIDQTRDVRRNQLALGRAEWRIASQQNLVIHDQWPRGFGEGLGKTGGLAVRMRILNLRANFWREKEFRGV